ncbi:MAG TPA: outer membrane protein [Syntrophorhabdaceae bacterium]|nr:outer membrane protein [Syntrophorhabdaceae bacterium]
MKKAVVVFSMVAVSLFFASVVLAQSGETYKWTGFYIGLNAGYGFGGNNGYSFGSVDPVWQTAVQSNWVDEPSFRPKGFVGGAQAGFDYQICDKLLVGVETDFQYSDIKDKNRGKSSTHFDELSQIKQDMEWFGTLRARFGVLPTQRLLIYGTGGLAYGKLKSSASVDFFSGDQIFAGSSTTTRSGYTGGGGIEFAVAKNITVKGEYLYYDLGRNEVDIVTARFTSPSYATGTFTTRGSIVRMGVNYRF